jgi:hypothetical protein
MNVPRYVLETREPMPGDGLSEVDATRVDEVLRSFLQHLLHSDPAKRPRHYALFVLTLEDTDKDGNDIVTTDTVTSMPKVDLHTVLRDWLHKETQ